MAASNAADEAALERSLESLEPVDVTVAARVLKEAKQILDRLGVTFFLQGGGLYWCNQGQRVDSVG